MSASHFPFTTTPFWASLCIQSSTELKQATSICLCSQTHGCCMQEFSMGMTKKTSVKFWLLCDFKLDHILEILKGFVTMGMCGRQMTHKVTKWRAEKMQALNTSITSGHIRKTRLCILITAVQKCLYPCLFNNNRKTYACHSVKIQYCSCISHMANWDVLNDLWNIYLALFSNLHGFHYQFRPIQKGVWSKGYTAPPTHWGLHDHHQVSLHYYSCS